MFVFSPYAVPVTDYNIRWLNEKVLVKKYI